ncbi:MAG: DUF424 family protein [Candidatus Pacearchaeota archaeon]
MKKQSKQDRVFIKIYEGNPKIVAICDYELLNKRFEEGKLQLEVNEKFFKGEIYSLSEARKKLAKIAEDYASFNIVGGKAVTLALELKIINSNKVIYIQKIPVALVL